ncbi:hypothetical protein K474DRAFT_1711028 [Panus rudis PR-1116 ss-1]|nr:hypothetical protein K474DRAFT_1711028 [Panus rudis PR-1116 ss-1]
MSSTLYASCAEALELAQSHKDDIEALLDPEVGFAPKLRQICEERLVELANDPDVPAEELAALRMEADTWGLLQAIMPLRKMALPPSPSPQSLLAQNPYTPTAALAQAILKSSKLLMELVVVREWLHEIAPEPVSDPGATNGYWKFTKYQVLQNVRMGKEREGGFVYELDPDAVNRGDGRTLAADDAAYEKALIQALYAYIRAGRLQDAIELCRKAQQPWRAASIRGTYVFQWKALSPEPKDEDAMEDEEDDFTGWKGNQRRTLWKTTCTRAALSPNLPSIERALYAALAPCPQTATQLRAACRTWEDHLWAQVCVMCEEKQSQELSKLKGFWENSSSFISGGDALVESSSPPGHVGAGDVSMRDEDDENHEWEREVKDALLSLRSITVEEGPPADDPYHVSQLHIILNETDFLLEEFAKRLKSGSWDPSAPHYPAMTRFFAHLCLFLQMIDVASPALATQVILEAYLQVLESAGQRELIAMYAGALGDNAIERYAMFLTSLELSADISERKLALTRARGHGLDMERVAIATAERTIEKAFSILPPPKGALPDVLGPQAGPSDGELLLLRSIEWNTFMESTYNVALEQANVILRFFLCHGRIHVAKSLLDSLPKELNTLREPEDQADEFLQYRQFFVVWDALQRVVECQSLEVPHMAKDTKAAWLQDYKVLIEQARDQVTKLLTTEWLLSEEERSNVRDRRQRELVRIRQIYIPVLILRLHNILYDSRRKIPENLKHALLLANIVADARYRLYDDFVPQEGRKLGDYLQAVRKAISAGLEGGGSDPFRVLHTL